MPPPLKPTSPPPLSWPDPSAQAQICSGRTGKPALLADSRAQPGFSSCQRYSLRITESGESPLKDSNNVYCAVTLGAPNSTLLMISEIADAMERDTIQSPARCCLDTAAFAMFGQLAGSTLMLMGAGPQRPTQPIKMLFRSV